MLKNNQSLLPVRDATREIDELVARIGKMHDTLIFGCAFSALVGACGVVFVMILLLEIPSSMGRGSFRPWAYPAMALFFCGSLVGLVFFILPKCVGWYSEHLHSSFFDVLSIGLFVSLGASVIAVVLVAIGFINVPWR
ncbi:hypothetical protein [Pandoraea sputorum]|uniref:hypothetical protein n=1 Tax=Pandoraea sputorum TaxID=93222 RepID=UPI002AF6A063|nr:hypothetical protein [Pandoraea sputorum]